MVYSIVVYTYGKLDERSYPALAVTKKFCECMQEENNAGNIEVIPIMNLDAYHKMVSELDNRRIEAVARNRLANFNPAKAVSHTEMRSRFAKKDWSKA